MKTVGILLVGLLLMVCCGESDQMSSITEIKRSHEAQWLALPDVSSVGIGKDAQGNRAIIVNLAKSNPGTQSQIPRRIDGYRVIVQISGPIKAQ